VLEPAYKNLMLGEENKLRLVSSDAAYSFLLGAVTAGLLSAPGAVIGEISNTRLGGRYWNPTMPRTWCSPRLA